MVKRGVIPGVKVTPLQVWRKEISRGVTFHDLVGAKKLEEERNHPILGPVANLNLARNVFKGTREIYRDHPHDAIYITGGLVDSGVRAALLIARDEMKYHALEMRIDLKGFDYVSRAATELFTPVLSSYITTSIDFGQTNIKVKCEDFEMTAKATKDPKKVMFELADLLYRWNNQAGNFDGDVVIAVPGIISDSLEITESLYEFEGFADFLQDKIDEGRCHGTKRRDIHLFNDAEIACVLAHEELPPRLKRILVLTLGTGPGAALLERP